MANFDSAKEILTLINQASFIGSQFKEVYNLCVSIEAKLDRYQTDQAFKDEVDHLYTLAQRQEINNMVQDVTTLREHWEANHWEALELPSPPSLSASASESPSPSPSESPSVSPSP